MTNEQRLIEALRRFGATDDDELSKRTGVNPRQQVNQICRRLEQRGILIRRMGPHGKIVNQLKSSGRRAEVEKPSLPSRTPARVTIVQGSASSDELLKPCPLEETLWVIPCSGSKRTGGRPQPNGRGLLDQLPEHLRQDLRDARQAVALRTRIDDSLLLPACERYKGSFYDGARAALETARVRGLHVLIVSGGYGLLAATEPIGIYGARFEQSW